ncbi:hypothetical protein NIES2111_65250 (plasmid) [Nostoc sp. NIES-2111]|nr:hypothetical protein NIES2111_65250 [Nostoc sp. NIES-2111]
MFFPPNWGICFVTRPQREPVSITSLGYKQMQRNNQNAINRMIALLLVMQLFLIGLQGKMIIDEGDSKLKVLIWMINQSIVVLQKVNRQQKEQNKDNH